MNIEAQEIQLKDGRTAVLRSPQKAEAEELIKYMQKTSGESDYMARYPKEVSDSIAEEEKFIADKLEAERDFLLAVFVDGKLAGNASIGEVLGFVKSRHRAAFGIAILQEYWGLSLGSLLLANCLKYAKELGYEQVELEVVSTNKRAIHLYEKYGFEKCGTVCHAQKKKDGSYQDEDVMICRL